MSLRYRLGMTDFINEKEELNMEKEVSKDTLMMKNKLVDPKRSVNGVEEEVKENEWLRRDEASFNGVCRASREVVLQSLLSRAGIRKLGPGSQRRIIEEMCTFYLTIPGFYC